MAEAAASANKPKAAVSDAQGPHPPLPHLHLHHGPIPTLPHAQYA